MRLVMMGTGPFAVPTFNSLLDSEHEVVALFTRPARPVRGRGKAPTNPMREVAQRRSIPVVEPGDINFVDARAQLTELHGDLFIVCDYGQILSRETLATARLAGINLHASLLPKYRGAAPINWAIYHGETQTGVTVIHMTPKLDAGPTLAQSEVDIGPEETAIELEQRLAQLGVEPVHEAIRMLADWDGTTPIGEVQDPAMATRAPRLSKSDGAVDWTRTAREIKNQVRAFKPWPGTYTYWHRSDGEPMRLILDEVSHVNQRPDASTPGRTVERVDNALWIATGDGILSIDKIQPAGKRVMAIDEFLRGHPVRSGESFGDVQPK